MPSPHIEKGTAVNTPVKKSPVVFCPAPGDTVCNAEGYTAEYVAPFDFGHVVRPIIEHRDEDGAPWDIVSTVPVIWTDVFPGDACPKMAAEIEEQRAALFAINMQIQEARSIQKAQSEIMARLKEHDVLRRLDGMLAGQATHYVTCGSDSNYNIHVVAEEKPDCTFGHERELRLLSLTARRPSSRNNNGLTWELNRYCDGSGSSMAVIPCFSLDEAKEVLGKRCADKWSAWLAGRGVSYIAYVADACRKWDLPIPQKYLDEEQARQLESIRAEVDRLTKAAETANAALLKLQADSSHAK